jgi:phosphoribosyl-AMP cyclohydrolase
MLAIISTAFRWNALGRNSGQANDVALLDGGASFRVPIIARVQRAGGVEKVSEESRQPDTALEQKAASPETGEEIAQPHHRRPLAETRLDFEKLGGLVPAIVQDHRTKEVLMVGFMNTEAWEKTVRTGLVTFWSRSRDSLWTKGETSGNHLRVRRIWTDCDADTVLVEADPRGPTCHTGARSCFFEEVVIDA